jgi:hypothetical protein
MFGKGVDHELFTMAPNNRLQATAGGLGVEMPARWACAHRA